MELATKVSHTPGPWRVGTFFDIVDADGRKLANVFRPSRISAEENFSNALVIAAAPDMLEALEFAQFLEELQATHNPQDIIRLLESRGDYESGHLSTEQMIAEYELKVALARAAAISKAKG